MEVLTRLDGERISALLTRDEFFWLDLVAPSDAELTGLGGLLGLHPLAIEDSREWGQRPKLDPYGDHVLLVYYTARVEEIHIYISGGFVVTVRRDEAPELEELHETLAHESTEQEEYIVYAILDRLTDAFIPAVGAFEGVIDELESEVLERVRRDQLARIYHLKQEVQQLQRLVLAQRDAVDDGVDVIVALPGLTTGNRAYLRDVVDHLEQLRSELARHLADLSSLVDTFFNANTNKLNRMTGVLTVIATFFLVWTLVTSFFGQNFGYLVDSVDTREDFLVYGVGGLVVPTLILAFVFWWRRDDWW